MNAFLVPFFYNLYFYNYFKINLLCTCFLIIYLFKFIIFILCVLSLYVCMCINNVSISLAPSSLVSVVLF